MSALVWIVCTSSFVGVLLGVWVLTRNADDGQGPLFRFLVKTCITLALVALASAALLAAMDVLSR